ncbi:MAG: CDP-alcohol phosphatidyltransferase family protein [Candidatus Methylomirabilales bacterium]|nr:CDP-diacylglycerol--glycerol-3-phosphate 3-phosphatidyltransferase [candidate division NC10 bacterium]MCZ6551890.1 CDP-alcohol phosphatidyltransferase family protein [candidate division NC10 bacterium]
MIFNLPNGLTFLRLILTPMIVFLLLRGAFSWALLLFLLAGITDGLDGFLARSLREPTEFGRVLDPVADKLLLGSAFFTLAFLGRLPLWLPVIAVGRDLVQMVGSCILYTTIGRLGYPPSFLGKLTTALQIFTVLAAMIMAEGDALLYPLIWVTAVVTVLSGLDYIYRGVVDLFSRSRNASPA